VRAIAAVRSTKWIIAASIALMRIALYAAAAAKRFAARPRQTFQATEAADYRLGITLVAC